MFRSLIVLALFAALTGGCATYPNPTQQKFEALPQRYAQFDVIMAWQTRVVDGKTLIDGIVKNVRYAYMYDLEIWVAVLDETGKERSRSVTFVIPRKLDMDEMAEFSLKLPVAAPPGTRLRFTYQYRGSEGGDGRGEGMERAPNWMQSFETVVPDR